MGVDGEGHPDIGVAQHLLGGRGMNAFLSERGGERVPQGVNRESLIRKVGSLQERLELTAVEVPAIHRSTQGVGEDEAVILPARAGL